MSEIDDWTQDIHVGDVRDRLSDLPADSVHMGMTSPPYFGLRDYDEAEQIGLEDSLDEYIAELVAVFDDIRRVLRPDGSFWLNLGDSFANKQKQLVPHRVAIALQENGWVVRNDVTWYKPNPMPSSVTDRLNTTTEQVFHLTPEPDYYYDLDAIREAHATTRAEYTNKLPQNEKANKTFENSSGEDISEYSTQEAIDRRFSQGKNPGDVFEVTTKPFPDAHFAVYPPELVEKPIKATCPKKVCASCGAPYNRDVEREGGPDGDHLAEVDRTAAAEASQANDRTPTGGTLAERYREYGYPDRIMNGWNQTCDCDTDDTDAGIALDPFAGAGTTAMVAKNHGRRFVGLELNPEYVAMAQKRLGLTVADPQFLRDDDATGLDQYGVSADE